MDGKAWRQPESAHFGRDSPYVPFISLKFSLSSRFLGYDDLQLNSTARFLASLKDASLHVRLGGHWLVLGSESPWIEAMLLEFGVAERVSTLEYANLSSCPSLHPKITPLLPQAPIA